MVWVCKLTESLGCGCGVISRRDILSPSVQIEACAIHLLEEEARRVVGSPSKLSQEELVYAKE